MQLEQRDGVQLLPLNADRHARQPACTRAHTCTSAILTGSARFKTFVFMEGFALASPPTVFHLTVRRGFLRSRSEDLGLCWSVFMAVLMAA